MANAKVLLFDIESGGVNALKPDLGFVFCFGYKWLGDPKTHCLRLDQYDGYTKTGFSDKKLLQAASKIIEEADLLVTHYGSEYDRKFINGRLVLNSLPPLPFTKMVDTCKLSWKYFNFSSARLVNLARHLKVKHQKMQSKFPEWWLGAMRKYLPHLKSMALYCKGDVDCLEEVYLKLRTFEETPLNLYDENRKPSKNMGSRCRLCGGLVNPRGFVLLLGGRYRRFKCSKCFRWSRDKKML